MSVLEFGWQTIKPWQDGYNLLHVSVYSWFPFDAHVDVLRTRGRISLFYYTRSIGLQIEAWNTMAGVRLHLGVTSFDVMWFWPRFWRLKRDAEDRAAFRAKHPALSNVGRAGEAAAEPSPQDASGPKEAAC